MMRARCCLMRLSNDRENLYAYPTQESVISFNSGHQTTVNEDQVEQAGQSILSLLDKAAGIAEANRRRATDVEQKPPISCAPPVSALPTWRPRSLLNNSGQIALSSGSILSTPRLKSASCGRMVTVPERTVDNCE